MDPQPISCGKGVKSHGNRVAQIQQQSTGLINIRVSSHIHVGDHQGVKNTGGTSG
jgi:hypothetical protein